MSNGVINPKGRRNLNESNRNLTKPFFGESDDSLGLNKVNWIKKPYIKPFSKVESKTNIKEIKSEIRRLAFSVRKKKSSIVALLIELYEFSKLEAEHVYFIAITNDRVRLNKKRKGGSNGKRAKNNLKSK